jgi:hypothetical protein
MEFNRGWKAAMKDKIKPEGGLRTEKEKDVITALESVFSRSPDSVAIRLQSFTKYIREQELRRLFSLYEIFQRVLPIKGSVIECGVYRGFGLMSWALLSSILEPINLTRRIYGFDTFEGFPGTTGEDKNVVGEVGKGALCSNSWDELTELIHLYDRNRFLGHIPKVKLIKGNAVETIPAFVRENRQLVVSLLFLDFDLYEPTKVAIDHFLPRMPKGSIIAFDELDNPLWPGETQALLDTIGVKNLKIERNSFDPYIGFAVID